MKELRKKSAGEMAAAAGLAKQGAKRAQFAMRTCDYLERTPPQSPAYVGYAEPNTNGISAAESAVRFLEQALEHAREGLKLMSQHE